MRHIFGFWRYAPNRKKHSRGGGPDAPFWRKCAKSGDTACIAGKERNRLEDTYTRFGAFYIEATGRYWKKNAAILATSNVSLPRRHFGGLSKKLCRDNKLSVPQSLG